MTDASLIAASVQEPERFAAIFDRHFGPIYRYLRRRLGQDLAEELAAETFTIAFSARLTYDLSRESALPWLFGIAANLSRRERRTERRKLLAYARSGVDPVGEDMAEADARLDAQSMGSELARVLASLTEGDRDALLLYAWADLSYEEVGQALAIPTGTVRSRLSRARRQLRELLDLGGQVVDEEGEEVERTEHG
jgi:RNA polymerase sigma-70 factor (ECF subfamily)